ncbi:hypothetical protein HK097_008153 [Rhizophlyctis rosea]|uniref:AMP-binding enzyme C-terminal domain-containing protein n=1 Tax=Rhizophlyctis rosea TaxID=64517 RepID=A0AAD5X4Q6_9FUNG|nr:hypothetical protein HK097_008153 [Rhizophlyctis rosea]
MGVPSIYAKLLQFEPTPQTDLKQICSQFRLMVSGSAPLPDTLFKGWEDRTGKRLLERERSGILLKVLRFELWVSGGQVFKEYWNNPTATRKELIDGWFKTGDIVRQAPDGRITILGRASADIIKSGGYKISALEIEREILDHPSVKDVAVLGVGDEVMGKVVGALIVLKDKQQSLTLEELRDFLKDRMAKYKLPRKMKVLDEVPRNIMGKVQKKLLKALFMEQEP